MTLWQICKLRRAETILLAFQFYKLLPMNEMKWPMNDRPKLSLRANSTRESQTVFVSYIGVEIPLLEFHRTYRKNHSHTNGNLWLIWNGHTHKNRLHHNTANHITKCVDAVTRIFVANFNVLRFGTVHFEQRRKKGTTISYLIYCCMHHTTDGW